ncbi:MAG: polyphosphate kinase 1 [Bacteroidota bacterium]
MIKELKGHLFKDRDISWMLFNERVLQEAENTETPLLERLKFLAIFSSNNDEFFRVRVASLRRLQQLNRNKAISEYQFPPDIVLGEIQRLSLIQQERFNKAFNHIIKALQANGIYIVNENQLEPEQKKYVEEFFKKDILPHVFPVILDHTKITPHLKDKSIYLAVRMSSAINEIASKHAIIEIPSPQLPRFYVLPKTDDKTRIMFIDDVIRCSLDRIFSIFNFDHFEAYTIKLTRDAEFTLDEGDNFRENLLEKLQRSLKQRSKGSPTRFIYDNSIPRNMLELVTDKLQLKNVNLIPGGRYHNFKDFMDFPKLNNPAFNYEALPPIPMPELDQARTIFEVISKKDFILHHPYQSFDYLIRMLREAAIDPKVQAINITLYRVAKYSNVVNALINAIKNGKKVTVLMELQARFDEESNIYWTTQLQEAGARVHFGKPGQKVHCKLCVIYREENGRIARYAHMSTGNYNGVTARLYCDHGLFTKDERITNDLEKLMDMLFQSPRKHKFNHLLVAPENMAKQFAALIDIEIANARAGKTAYIIAKMNSLIDEQIIRKLYEAGKAGVQIDLIVRGICGIVPGIAGLSDNIRVRSIIDRFLEHARVYIFANGGHEKIYLASADWMTRNLHHRIESGFPIFDEEIKKEIRHIIKLQLIDNIKARVIDSDYDNKYAGTDTEVKYRAQLDIYHYLKNKYQ